MLTRSARGLGNGEKEVKKKKWSCLFFGVDSPFQIFLFMLRNPQESYTPLLTAPWGQERAEFGCSRHNLSCAVVVVQEREKRTSSLREGYPVLFQNCLWRQRFRPAKARRSFFVLCLRRYAVKIYSCQCTQRWLRQSHRYAVSKHEESTMHSSTLQFTHTPSLHSFSSHK